MTQSTALKRYFLPSSYCVLALRQGKKSCSNDSIHCIKQYFHRLYCSKAGNAIIDTAFHLCSKAGTLILCSKAGMFILCSKAGMFILCSKAGMFILCSKENHVLMAALQEVSCDRVVKTFDCQPLIPRLLASFSILERMDIIMTYYLLAT